MRGQDIAEYAIMMAVILVTWLVRFGCRQQFKHAVFQRSQFYPVASVAPSDILTRFSSCLSALDDTNLRVI